MEGGAPLWGSIGGASGASRRGFGTHSGPGLCGGNSSLLVEFGNRRLARMPTGSPGAWPIRSGSCARTSASACCRGAPEAGSLERLVGALDVVEGDVEIATPKGALRRRVGHHGVRNPPRSVPARGQCPCRSYHAASFGSRTLPAKCAPAVPCQVPRQKCRNKAPTAALQSSRRRAWTYRQPEHPKMIAAAATIARAIRPASLRASGSALAGRAVQHRAALIQRPATGAPGQASSNPIAISTPPWHLRGRDLHGQDAHHCQQLRRSRQLRLLRWPSLPQGHRRVHAPVRLPQLVDPQSPRAGTGGPKGGSSFECQGAIKRDAGAHPRRTHR